MSVALWLQYPAKYVIWALKRFLSYGEWAIGLAVEGRELRAFPISVQNSDPSGMPEWLGTAM